MITLAVVTDGRDDLLASTLTSASQMLHPQKLISRRIVWDDTGDAAHIANLAVVNQGFDVAGNSRRNGFGGAVRQLWRRLRRYDTPFIFWCEDDFVFNRPVDLAAMAETLSCCSHLAQLALTRQPWNPAEQAAGTILDPPEDFTQRGDPAWNQWIEHRRWWTTNPSLFRREILDEDWPAGDQSEGRFTHHLLTEGFGGIAAADVRFGYWGNVDDGPWVEHIGHTRTGTGY